VEEEMGEEKSFEMHIIMIFFFF